MALKKIGYYIVKGKCVKVYSTKKRNRAGKLVTKRVNYKGKVLKKGTKVYKRKADCLKELKKKMKKTKTKKTRKDRKVRKVRKDRKVRNKFGEKSSCAYAVPYFGTMVPSIAKTWSGTNDTGITSSAWAWPTPPSAKYVDMQQGQWLKVKNLKN